MTSYVEILRNGGIGIIPTDTLYGIVGSALQQNTIERMYELKGRTVTKPFIILISSYEEIAPFGITLTEEMRSMLTTYWPGPVSIILPCPDATFSYLHRGNFSLAFRLPQKESLRELLCYSGPLAAPSANPEGLPPATTIAQAREYFGTRVDFYVDEGTIVGTPSKLITIDSQGDVMVLRG